MSDTEFKKPYPKSFPNYEINRFGVVRNTKTKNTLKHISTGFGYQFVNLTQNGKRRRGYIHRMIWRAFKGDIPHDWQIHHKNNLSDDNRLENLELTSPFDNIRYRWERAWSESE